MAWDENLIYEETGLTSGKQGEDILVGPGGILEIEIQTANVSGTSPTLDVTIEETDDQSSYSTVVQTKQFTGADREKIFIKPTKHYIRYNLSIGGSDTPTFDVTFRIR